MALDAGHRTEVYDDAVSAFGRVFLVLAATSGLTQSALPPLPADLPSNARRYISLNRDRPGRMAAWRGPDEALHVVSQQRHPDGCVSSVRSTIAIDVVGAIVWLKHTGQGCEPGRVVDETYTRSGSLGIWKNHLGQGEGDVIGKKFYMSANASAEERAQLVRALLAAGDELNLLPQGTARAARIVTLLVKAAGGSQNVTLYRVSGLGLAQEPLLLWTDSSNELFATGDLIREGWEASAPELRRIEAESRVDWSGLQ